jgi:hypothetical protein
MKLKITPFILLILIILTSTTVNAQDTTQYDRATDSLKQVVHFLENLLQSVEKSKNDAEKQVAIMGRYIKDAQKMETTLGNNFGMLHPKNETFKTELTRQFHFIMQSVALYRSDLRSTNFTSTENTNRELKYLTDQIPQLMEKLTYMITYHQHTDWDKQKKIDELNGYLQDAYGTNTPIQFSVDGITSKETNSVRWSEVKNMIVDRNKNEVCISTHSNDNIKFVFTEEQYTHIASMHVHFLAFVDKMKNTIKSTYSSSVQNNIERANQLLQELLPNEKITVYSEGIRLDEYTYLTFSDTTFDSIVYINIEEENEIHYLNFCCVIVLEFENSNNLEEYTTKFATTAYHFPSTQLPLAEEFKTIIQNMKAGK